MTSSDLTLAFVQQSQVVVGNWSYLPDTQRLSAAWWCLLNAPSHEAEMDVAVFTAVVVRMATGILTRSEFCNGQYPLPRRPVARDWAAALLALVRDGHADEGASLGRYAKYRGLSRWHLSRILLKESGCDFRTHLNGLRVCNAVSLLDKTGLSVKEIASHVGYQYATELDRHFQRWFRMPPRDFRRWLRSGMAPSIGVNSGSPGGGA